MKFSRAIALTAVFICCSGQISYAATKTTICERHLVRSRHEVLYRETSRKYAIPLPEEILERHVILKDIELALWAILSKSSYIDNTAAIPRSHFYFRKSFESAKSKLLAEDGNAELLTLIENVLAEQKIYSDWVVNGNIRFALWMIPRYFWLKLERDDIAQASMVGLRKAAEVFVPERGVPFITFAKIVIDHTIKRANIQEGNTIRISVPMHEELNRYLKAQNSFFLRTGRNPTTEEIAQELGVKTKKIDSYKKALLNSHTLSLDVPASKKDDKIFGAEETLGDTVASSQPQAFELLGGREETALLVETMKKVLTPTEQLVLALRFGAGETGEIETLEEIGQRLNLSNEKVRLMEIKAINKLKAEMTQSESTDQKIKDTQNKKGAQEIKLPQALQPAREQKRAQEIKLASELRLSQKEELDFSPEQKRQITQKQKSKRHAKFLLEIKVTEEQKPTETSSVTRAKTLLEDAIDLLTPIEQELVALRYGATENRKSLNEREISAVIKMRPSHIEQMIKMARLKLQKIPGATTERKISPPMIEALRKKLSAEKTTD